MLLFLTVLFSICINSEKVFIACEGNYYDGSQGTLWSMYDNAVFEYGNNPIGNVAQSLYVHEDKLFVIVNGSSNIQVFDIIQNDLVPINVIDTGGSGPREMVVFNNNLYFTNWYSMDVKIINLETWNIDTTIPMPGLPEDIIFKDGLHMIQCLVRFDLPLQRSGNVPSEIFQRVLTAGNGTQDVEFLNHSKIALSISHRHLRNTK